MAETSEGTTNQDQVPSYARLPVFPQRGHSRSYNRYRKQRTTRGDQSTNNPSTSQTNEIEPGEDQPMRSNRGGRGRGRGGNRPQAKESNRPPTFQGNPLQEPSTSKENPRQRGNGRQRNQNQSNRRGNTGQIPSLFNCQLDPQQFQGFNPDAVPFIPSNQVRLTNLVELPIPQRNKPVNRNYNGPREEKEPQRAERKSQQAKAPRQSRRAPKRVENPNAPLRERLKNQLEDNDYECMICCQVVTAKQGIWSCKKCFNMFHISGGCIVNWARKSRQEDPLEQWRCPTCQTRYEQVPYNYFCFCGKERNPTSQIGETPHSCGQLCGGERGPGCPHPCSEPCHPGPCAECPVMVTQRCNCGRIEKTTRCGAGVQISCDQICGKLLNCGNHVCKKTCHAGSCPSCEEVSSQKCYCEDSEKIVPCNSGNEYAFSCGKFCDGKYDCGIHDCISRCHLTGENCGICIFSPEKVTNCPCGKFSLLELGEKGVRTSCSDPVPVCESICNKILPCGSQEKSHRCRSKCHTGPCPPCDFNSSVVCRCGQVKRSMPCQEYLQILERGEFLCERKCKKPKSCGKHTCQEVCCIQDVHLCTMVCNRRLNCGLHQCEYLCHPGDCVRCLQASFDEQFCHCGRTMRPPPIPCGTSLPECDEPCARPHSCDHPVNHKCHSMTICPPCTFLVERECYGKHEVRKNIPCHIQGISCGRECGKPLPCNIHVCKRRCHQGECLKPEEKCSQPCAIIRTSCEHPCNVPCHGTSPCPETVCNFEVVALCECGRRKENKRCVEVEKEKQRLRALAVESAVESGEESQKETLLKRSRSMENLAVLSCNDECKKVARNKKLAEALSIVTNDDGDVESPTITFTETMKSGLKTYPQLVLELENIFTKLIEFLDDQTNSSSVASYNFAPMQMEKRRLIHEYASYFQIESISVDEVPKRSVIITGRRGIAKPPLILLSDLNKYPSVLKFTGSTTIRHNVNDDIKKAAAEEEGGMKQLKSNRTVYKRMAPKIFVPEPVKQSNSFAALCSDAEEEDDENKVDSNPQPNTHEPEEKDVDWWTDEEEYKEEAPLEVGEIQAAVQELEQLKIPEDIRDSWSDAE